MSECLCIYFSKRRKRKKPQFFCFPGSETKETALYFPQKREMESFTLKTLSCSPCWRREVRMKIWGANCYGANCCPCKMFLERLPTFFEGGKKTMNMKNSLTLQNFKSLKTVTFWIKNKLEGYIRDVAF